MRCPSLCVLNYSQPEVSCTRPSHSLKLLGKQCRVQNTNVAAEHMQSQQKQQLMKWITGHFCSFPTCKLIWHGIHNTWLALFCVTSTGKRGKTYIFVGETKLLITSLGLAKTQFLVNRWVSFTRGNAIIFCLLEMRQSTNHGYLRKGCLSTHLFILLSICISVHPSRLCRPHISSTAAPIHTNSSFVEASTSVGVRCHIYSSVRQVMGCL